jgi:hypothetical protein
MVFTYDNFMLLIDLTKDISLQFTRPDLLELHKEPIKFIFEVGDMVVEQIEVVHSITKLDGVEKM